jgi:hypothetical protein
MLRLHSVSDGMHTLSLPCGEGRHRDCPGYDETFGDRCECDCHRS